MDLLVVRHAIAEPWARFARSGQPDELRPTTPGGRRRMRRVAAALARLQPTVDVIASSPLLRARETADILADGYPSAERQTRTELGPDAPVSGLLGWLRDRADTGCLAVVGHEPHLSHLVSWLLADRLCSFLELKKGSAGLLRFAARPAAGEATLLWLLQPGQLRRLAAGGD